MPGIRFATRRFIVCVACALAGVFAARFAGGQDAGADKPTPPARVTSLRPVVRDGWYNAFTDLVYWRNFYWLADRRGTFHGQIKGNSVSVILRSNDLWRWHEAKVFEPPGGVANGGGAHRGCFEGLFRSGRGEAARLLP